MRSMRFSVSRPLIRWRTAFRSSASTSLSTSAAGSDLSAMLIPPHHTRSAAAGRRAVSSRGSIAGLEPDGHGEDSGDWVAWPPDWWTGSCPVAAVVALCRAQRFEDRDAVTIERNPYEGRSAVVRLDGVALFVHQVDDLATLQACGLRQPRWRPPAGRSAGSVRLSRHHRGYARYMDRSRRSRGDGVWLSRGVTRAMSAMERSGSTYRAPPGRSLRWTAIPSPPLP